MGGKKGEGRGRRGGEGAAFGGSVPLLDANTADKSDKRAKKWPRLDHTTTIGQAAREPKGRPNGAKMGFKISAAAKVEYQAIFDSKIIRTNINNQIQIIKNLKLKLNKDF